MKIPYFVTNRKEYENVLKPLLLKWGYKERLNKNCGYNIIVLNDCNLLGVICNYTDVMQIDPHNRYKESNIHRFLEKAAELMEKEYKPFLGTEDAIYCPTKELANQVLEIADKLGYSWCSGKILKVIQSGILIKKKLVILFMKENLLLEDSIKNVIITLSQQKNSLTFIRKNI